MADRVRSQSSSKGTSSSVWTEQTGTPEHGYSNLVGYPSYGNNPLGSVTKTTTDVVTPNFRSRIDKGEIICNPFHSIEVEETLSAPGSCERIYRSKTGYSCSSGHPTATHYTHSKGFGTIRPALADYLLPSFALNSLTASLAAQAVTEAFANIDTSEMLALATVAESGKSYRSMLGIYGRLRKILRHARRLRVEELAKELSPKEIANRWMEVRYAIRPLIYDAYGIANSLQKNRGYERRTFRGSAVGSTSESDVVNGVGIAGRVLHNCNRTNTLESSARAGVLCDVSINDLTVFGVDQLFETAWELAPLSFIVDWFVNVGDWIAAHTPNAGVNQRASWVTTKGVLTQTVSGGQAYWSLLSSQEAVSLSMCSSSKTKVSTEIIRSVDPSISSFPAVDMRLDTFKLTDLGIILRKYLS